MSLIEHFYECDKGCVLIDGNPVTEYDHEYIHQKVSLLPSFCFGLERMYIDRLAKQFWNVLLVQYFLGGKFEFFQIALVAQDPILYEGTVRDNIVYGCDWATEEDVLNAAKIANAHNFIMETEKQYETNCGEKGIQLSGNLQGNDVLSSMGSSGRIVLMTG